MKKISAFLVGAGLIASSVLAADPVTSVNAVGYVSLTAPSGKYVLIGSPFATVGSSTNKITISEMLGTNGIPDNAIVYIYNGSSYDGEVFYEGEGGGWFPGTNKLSRTDGFWFNAPATTVLTLAGGVPDAATALNTTAEIDMGYQLLAYPYPVSQSVTNTGLNNVASDGDIIYKWSGSNYVGYAYYDGSGWFPQDLAFGPSEGFWYYKSTLGTTNWTESKPYNWP